MLTPGLEVWKLIEVRRPHRHLQEACRPDGCLRDTASTLSPALLFLNLLSPQVKLVGDTRVLRESMDVKQFPPLLCWKVHC